jgi:hypothetical protein
VEGRRVGWRSRYEFAEKKMGSRMAGQKEKKKKRHGRKKNENQEKKT